MQAFGKYELPKNTTHVAKGRYAGCFYKTSDNELWRFVDDLGREDFCEMVINMENQSHLGIHKIGGYVTKSKPVTEVSIDKECKERVGQLFGSFPDGEAFISNGFIKKGDLVKGSGWRIGATGCFDVSSLTTTVTHEMIIEALNQFVPDFTKHKDCDIAVIRDIVEQYRNKIKQLQESKK